MKLIDLLYDCALKYDGLWECVEDENTADIESLAVNHVFAVNERKQLETYMECFLTLPYDSTESLEAVLCFLASQDLTNSWKAAQLKMGLFLVNEVGRTAWTILFSSMLYTFEILVKFRKGRGS